MSDWIGFPTLYYVPVPQSVSEIQIIRGGSSLLYGPEPAPAINYVTKHPAQGTPWSAYAEQTGGSNGTYSTYAAVQEANGPVEMRLDGYYGTSEGQRDNAEYGLWQANGYLGYRPDSAPAPRARRSRQPFQRRRSGPSQLPRNGRPIPIRPSRPIITTGSIVIPLLSATNYEFSDDWLMQAKAWFTHQDIDSRTAANLGETSRRPGAFSHQHHLRL